MLITPLFAALFSLLYVALTLNVVRHRFTKRISLGNAGDKATERAVRAHSNFIEYVPLCLLLLYFNEMVTLSSHLVFYLAITLLIGRVMHVIGMLRPYRWMILRQIGMVLTILVIVTSSLSLALRYLPISV